MGTQCWRVTTVLLSILELLLLVIGTAAPLWVWLDDGDDHVGVGLFNRVGWEPDGINERPDDFNKVKFADEDTIDEDHWTAMAVLFVTSCALACLVLVLLLVYFIKSRDKHKVTVWYSLLMLCSVLAWICCFVGLIIFLAHHGDAVTTSRQIDDISFSWSFLLCLLGGAVGVLVTFLIATKIKKQRLNAIPAALDSKIGMYPTTQTGFDNHVFQGMPYSNIILPNVDAKEESQHSQSQQLAITPPEDNLSDQRQLIRGMIRETESPQRLGVYNNVNGHSNYMNRVNGEFAQRVEPAPALPPRDELVLYRGQGNQRAPSNLPRNSFREPLRADGEKLFFSPDSKLNRRVIGSAVPLGRQNQDNDRAGETLEEEVVYNSLRDRGLNPRPGIEPGDFLVTARHGQDRAVHRDAKTYLSHTIKPAAADDNVHGQRLVLSPSNFTNSNVKYNPSLTYKPFGSQVY